MEVLLNDLIPRLFPTLPFLCVSHEVTGARRMAQHLTRTGNRSRSFQVLLDGIGAVAGKLGPPGRELE